MINKILIPKNKTRMDEVNVIAPLFLLSSLTILATAVFIQENGASAILMLILLISALFAIATGCMIANVFEFVTEEKIQHRKQGIAFIQKTLLDNMSITIPTGYAKALYYRKNTPIYFTNVDKMPVTIHMVKQGKSYALEVDRTRQTFPLEQFNNYVKL